MKHAPLLWFLVLSSSLPCVLQGFGNKTFFSPRSQSVNGALELVGWESLIHLDDGRDRWYMTWALTPLYSRSLVPKQLAQFLFGSPCFIVSGSRVPDRSATDVLGDYFGLSPNYKSSVSVEPAIGSFLMDFNWFIGLDEVLSGLYVQFHLPIVHTTWDLGLTECVLITGTQPQPAGYMASQDVAATTLPKTFKQSLHGHTTFGDMREPLKYGKVFDRQTLTHTSDIQVSVGWDFLLSDWYHFGIFARGVLATGNTPDSHFLFEAIAGNCGCWEAGAGFTGHVQLWQSWDEDQVLALYCFAWASHLFANHQRRSYDFITNGPGSRYMLVERFNSPSQDLFVGSPAGPAVANQYQGRLLPAINITTLKSIISVPVQANGVLKLAYSWGPFEFDVGYDVWYRHAERLHCRTKIPTNAFAFKGDAQVYGFEMAGLGNAIALSATQQQATINAGQGTANIQLTNNNADNPVIAASTAGLLTQVTPQDAALFGIMPSAVNSSSPGLTVLDSDINEQSGLLPKALSHKIFANFNTIWDFTTVQPYLGIGFAGEVAHTCSSDNSGYTQWSIWMRGGLSY